MALAEVTVTVKGRKTVEKEQELLGNWAWQGSIGASSLAQIGL